MFKRIGNQGFTLIELVMVIVILAILAIVAVPKFFDIGGRAKTAARDGVVGGVRAGIATVQADNLAGGATPPGYPAALDPIAGPFPVICGTADVCFANVLGQGGVTSSDWRKDSATTYTYIPTATLFTYTVATGSFI